jgi:hypothetical protein
MIYRVRKIALNTNEAGYGLVEIYRSPHNGSENWTTRSMAPASVMPLDDPDADRKAIVELADQLTGMMDALAMPIISDEQDHDTVEQPETIAPAEG